MRINKHNIVTRISTKSLPDSIVNYLVAISEWIPDYALIEERIRTEEEKKRIACKIAFDALKKIVDETLKDKGYKYTLKNQGYYNTAALHIKAGNCIRMKFGFHIFRFVYYIFYRSASEFSSYQGDSAVSTTVVAAFRYLEICGIVGGGEHAVAAEF